MPRLKRDDTQERLATRSRLSAVRSTESNGLAWSMRPSNPPPVGARVDPGIAEARRAIAASMAQASRP